MLNQEEAEGLGKVFVTGIVIAFLAITIGFIFLAARPMQLEMERQAITHSQQYVQSTVDSLYLEHEAIREIDRDMALGELTQEERDLLEGQRESICSHVRREAAQIPAGEVPPGLLQTCNARIP